MSDKDYIESVIFSRCSLTERQLETILSLRGENPRGRSVTRGSFHRTLRQAQGNIESSLYTVILLEYLGLAPSDCLSQIAKLSESLPKVKERHPTKDQVEQLLLAMEALMEQYSGKRKVLV